MDRLQAMQVFTRVVDTNSFTRAADTLGMQRASITMIIQNLEAFLKVRLLQRTTRRLNLTPEGAAYYERCVRVLAEIDEMENTFSSADTGPRGKLRIDMPGSIGRLIVMPELEEFQNRYPDIDLMLGFGERPVDLVQEGVDCVIRVGMLQDSSLVARRIGTFQGVTAASPGYIERYGMPRTINDLQQHVAVNCFSTRSGRVMDMDFIVDGKPIDVKMRGTVAVNDGDPYLACGLRGRGLIQVGRFMALSHLQSGELIEVLPQWKPVSMPISVVYPHNRHLSPKVRVFVDWVAELFERCALLADPDESTLGNGSASGRKTVRHDKSREAGTATIVA